MARIKVVARQTGPTKMPRHLQEHHTALQQENSSTVHPGTARKTVPGAKLKVRMKLSTAQTRIYKLSSTI
jgi:hypothetical protein